jgi:hypothetical protein
MCLFCSSAARLLVSAQLFFSLFFVFPVIKFSSQEGYMAKEYTIKEVKAKKIELEAKLLDCIKEFETETGVKVSYMNIEHKQDKTDSPVAMPEEDGPVTNVNCELRYMDIM